MEKIDGFSAAYIAPSFFQSTLAQNSDTKKTKPIRTKFPFFNLLKKMEQDAEIADMENLEVTQETIDKLMNEIHSKGDELRNHPLPQEILRYKKAVRDFLNFMVKNTYDIEKKTGIRRKREEGQHVFFQVKVIDQKLEQLVMVLLAGQADQMKILTRLEEINGLLVNLLWG
ncbi:MAG: YaaR family protein [Treponema sp.]|jgi:uncharacterized protein YaaR (DUF327 family)|nr:YaaR family protein [Treponema sp.]